MFDGCETSSRREADRLYVDACSALLVKRLGFRREVMENMFGDILPT